MSGPLLWYLLASVPISDLYFLGDSLNFTFTYCY